MISEPVLFQAAIYGISTVTIKLLLPVFFYLLFCAAVEYALNAAEKSVSNNWWFLFAILTALVIDIIWKEWTSSVNIAEHIRFGENSITMVLGVIGFILFSIIVLSIMIIAGIRQCILEMSFGGVWLFLVRLSQIIPLFLIIAKASINWDSYVGEHGLFHELFLWINE